MNKEEDEIHEIALLFRMKFDLSFSITIYPCIPSSISALPSPAL